MAPDPFAHFNIPTDMRAFAEKSVEQARQAFDSFVSAANEAVSSMEGRAAAAQAGAKDVGRKAIGFAEQNVAASFELARKLVRAKDVDEVMRLHADYVKEQMQALSEQAKALGESASRMAQAGKPDGGGAGA